MDYRLVENSHRINTSIRVNSYLFLGAAAGLFTTGFLAAGFLAGVVDFLGFISVAGFIAGFGFILAGALGATLVAGLLAALAIGFLVAGLEVGSAAVFALVLVAVF
jgi:hypothetical protein